MNILGTSLKQYKNLIKYFLVLFILGLLIGIILYEKIDNNYFIEETKNITNYLKNNNINYIFFHFVTISILITSSITIIGLIFFPLCIIFESASIGYNLIAFLSVFKFKGLLYGILYNLITKGIYILLIVLIFKKIIEIIKIFLNKVIYKEKDNFKYDIIKYIKKITIYIGLIILNDILLYLLGSNFLLKLSFIIK